MKPNEYNSTKATIHELSSEKNEDRMDSAVSKLNDGDSFKKELTAIE